MEGKAEFTKHMIRMRHAGQVQTRPAANEIILINSHDGASSYQMLAGLLRFVCCNGLVVGEVVEHPHPAPMSSSRLCVVDRPVGRDAQCYERRGRGVARGRMSFYT